MSTVRVDDKNFTKEVLEIQGTVLVDFYAEWCSPCRMMRPVLEELAKELGDAVKVVNLNVEESLQTAVRFEVHSIPVFAIFHNGELREKITGVVSKEFMKHKVELYVSNES